MWRHSNWDIRKRLGVSRMKNTHIRSIARAGWCFTSYKTLSTLNRMRSPMSTYARSYGWEWISLIDSWKQIYQRHMQYFCCELRSPAYASGLISFLDMINSLVEFSNYFSAQLKKKIGMQSDSVGLGGLGVTCSRDQRFVVSNPAEVDGLFQDVKILCTYKHCCFHLPCLVVMLKTTLILFCKHL